MAPRAKVDVTLAEEFNGARHIDIGRSQLLWIGFLAYACSVLILSPLLILCVSGIRGA